MSRNEDVTTGIWVDLMELSPDAKLLYLWSFTNEHNGMSGLYKIHEAMIGVETGLPADRVAAALREVAEQRFAFYVDGVLFVRSRVKRLRQRTPQIAKSIVKDLSQLRADHPLRARFLEVYGSESWLRDALREAEMLRVKRGSSEAHEKTDKQGPHASLTRASGEAPLSGEGKGLSSSSSGQQLPSEFPEDLRAHLLVAHRILSDLAARHGAKEVKLVALASIVMANPNKPLARSAYECAAYWDGKNSRLKDVVAAYRNWLAKADDLAGRESLPGSTVASNVHHLQRPEALQRADAWKAGYEGAS